ncbi:MAG: GNAT family N-acetyltransferase [Lachnospiraceae bacterium]|nr:GNAT family N-acetyltransferase [Lachnospiraceae bacterium]
MLVRELAMDDVSSIGNIYAEAFEHQPETLKFYRIEPYVQFCKDAGYAFVAEETGKIDGFILGYERPDIFNGRIAFIELLAVRPDAQKQGYARKLIERFAEAARANGIKELTVATACYKDAYLIYRHLGFMDCQSDMRTLFKRI